MRVATGGFWHETHTFSSVLTTLDDFKHYGYHEGDDILQALTGTRTTMGGFIAGCQELGIELVPTINTGAMPSGTVTRETYDRLEDRLAGMIAAVGQVDGLLISLHGAMVTEGLEDAEGHTLSRLRDLVGPRIPIVATTDLHANISPLMAEMADVIIGYDTYPHIDAYERAHEATQVLAGIIHGRIRPSVSLSKPPLIPVPQVQYTALPPMSNLLARAFEMEQDQRVVTITVAAGFPYSDVPKTGMSFLVATNSDPALAATLAQELGEMAWRERAGFVADNVTAAEAVQQALLAQNGTTVLVDVADNIGGGSPGDGTVLLGELLQAGAQGALVVLADAQAVHEAARAGINAQVQLAVGGKTDSRHGKPVPIRGRVRLLCDGEYVNKGSYMTGQRGHMGLTAVLDCGGLTLVLTERKVPPFDAEHVRSLGIDPAEQKIIVAKSAIAWRAAFGDVAKTVIDVDTPGLCSIHLEDFAFRHIRRPIFPLDREAMGPGKVWQRTARQG